MLMRYGKKNNPAKLHFVNELLRAKPLRWSAVLLFYVEAKYRSRRNRNADVRCTYGAQLDRYRSYNREYPTLLILGLGGTPTQPALVTLLPIEEIYLNLFNSQIRKFQIEANEAISADVLWSRQRRPVFVHSLAKISNGWISPSSAALMAFR
jgi:hypothetical protein